MDSLPVGDKMENFIIAFDVDGTLISNINENVIQERRVHGQVYPFDAANTQVVEFLILCSRIFKNVKVVVWSAGGQEYAQQWVERLQLEKYVWRTYSKSQYQELCSARKVIAIDDIHKTRLGNVANLIVKMK
jgi:phosphoserine phosphatase